MPSFSGLIVFLGTDRLHDPCQRTAGAQVATVSCGDPVSQVAPGGVLVRWDEDGFPPGIPAEQSEITAMLKTVRFTAAKRAPSSRGLRRHEPGGIAHDVASVRAQQDLNPAGDDLTRDEIHSQIAVNDEEQVDQVRVVGH